MNFTDHGIILDARAHGETQSIVNAGPGLFMAGRGGACGRFCNRAMR